MDIDSLQKLCVHLNEFALSRAIVDFDRQCFVAWNDQFLSCTGYSEVDIKAIPADKIIVESDSHFSNPNEGDNPSAKFIPIAIRTAKAAAAEPGHLVRSNHNLGYIMLDGVSKASTSFEQGRLVGKEQERMRIVRMFEEEVSSGVLGAVFKLHTAKEKLKSIDSPEAAQVSEASDLLTEAIEKMDVVIDDEKRN
ncbi:MAG: hypothetical protein JO025_03485 [Verrucomicrobia bacterium]|jgi:hypothetical protein|nr:hypothetical protein [Verrucomicrobiota bacterium]